MSDRELISDCAAYIDSVKSLYPYGVPEDLIVSDGEVAVEDFKRDTGTALEGMHVLAKGDKEAELIFVGSEALKLEHDAWPFGGKTRDLLEAAITKGMQLDVAKLHFVNLGYGTVAGDFVAAYNGLEGARSSFDELIAQIKPKVLISLGKMPASFFLGREIDFLAERGKWHEYLGTSLILTNDLDSVLHDSQRKREFWEDLQAVLGRLVK